MICYYCASGSSFKKLLTISLCLFYYLDWSASAFFCGLANFLGSYPKLLNNSSPPTTWFFCSSISFSLIANKFFFFP
jgi:hypothetical protein